MTFLHPVPDDLGAAYAGGYQAVPQSLQQFKRMAGRQAYRLETVRKFKRSGRLLEIGPWIGMFSFNAKESGFQVEAIEMDPIASAFMRDTLGIPVEATNDVLGALERSAARYDVIALWHSLEHISTPCDVFASVSRKLAPGGILVVAIPDLHSPQARRLGSHWFHLDAPRHITFWSTAGLARLGEQHGLRLLELRTDDRLSRELWTDAWKHRVWSLVRIKFLRSVAARIAGLLLLPWSTAGAEIGRAHV